MNDLLSKVAKFTVALTKHVATGKRMLPMDIVQKRLDICVKCEHFTGTRCGICGCGTNGRQSLLNKLAYPDQRCPDKSPRWLEDTINYRALRAQNNEVQSSETVHKNGRRYRSTGNVADLPGDTVGNQ